MIANDAKMTPTPEPVPEPVPMTCTTSAPTAVPEPVPEPSATIALPPAIVTVPVPSPVPEWAAMPPSSMAMIHDTGGRAPTGVPSQPTIPAQPTNWLRDGPALLYWARVSETVEPPSARPGFLFSTL